MEQAHQSTEARLASALRSESELIRGAIELVATGGSARVTLAGLRFGAELLEQSRLLAEHQGVRIEPLWSTDEVGGVDIVVERISDPTGR